MWKVYCSLLLCGLASSWPAIHKDKDYIYYDTYMYHEPIIDHWDDFIDPTPDQVDYDANCELTLKKGGVEITDGSSVLAVSGQTNQVYCYAFCTGAGASPALTFYKGGDEVSRIISRIYYVTHTSDRSAVLYVQNMLSSDEGEYTCEGWLRGLGYKSKSFSLVFACPHDQTMCDSSSCLDLSKVCDGVPDCDDQTDELDCGGINCSATEFACDGGCIPAEYKCDGLPDCIDAKDESLETCHCDFLCEDGQCLEKGEVCDGMDHCLNGEDELNCSQDKCSKDEWFCGTECVHKDLICSGQQLCTNDFDYLNCETDPPVIVCEFDCGNGVCISDSQTCDGVWDCATGSDEFDCYDPKCEFDCGDGLCVREEEVCDGNIDCLGTERDEMNCPAPVSDCKLSLSKDGVDIADGAHVVADSGELNKVYCEAFCTGSGASPSLEFHKDGELVSQIAGRVFFITLSSERMAVLYVDNMLPADEGEYTCTGWIDKSFRETSFYLASACPPDYKQCDKNRCVATNKWCDGVQDCEDKTDELHCGKLDNY